MSNCGRFEGEDFWTGSMMLGLDRESRLEETTGVNLDVNLDVSLVWMIRWFEKIRFHCVRRLLGARAATVATLVPPLLKQIEKIRAC